jgi:hypothetical protein
MLPNEGVAPFVYTNELTLLKAAVAIKLVDIEYGLVKTLGARISKKTPFARAPSAGTSPLAG